MLRCTILQWKKMLTTATPSWPHVSMKRLGSAGRVLGQAPLPMTMAAATAATTTTFHPAAFAIVSPRGFSAAFAVNPSRARGSERSARFTHTRYSYWMSVPASNASVTSRNSFTKSITEVLLYVFLKFVNCVTELKMSIFLLYVK